MSAMYDLVIEQIKLDRVGFDVATASYFRLSSEQKELLTFWAVQCNYRKPRNANGSTSRHFFESLKRHARQEAKQ